MLDMSVLIQIWINLLLFCSDHFNPRATSLELKSAQVIKLKIRNFYFRKMEF